VIAVDTSVVVRYLVGTPPDQARRAARLMDGPERIGIPAVVLLELAHVLRTQYDVARQDILETALQLVSREDVEILGIPKSELLDALGRARGLPGPPFADALIAATARAGRALPLYSFDRGMARHGIPVIEP
jgi:predicted nucleic acid-binding protein